MAREFVQNALADNDVVAGQIGIGCFESVVPLYLRRLIGRFSATAPGGGKSASAATSSRSGCRG